MASSSTQEAQEEIIEMEPGPVDATVLYLQDRHRSNNNILMTGKDPDRIIDHTVSVGAVTSSHPGVLALLERAGFGIVQQLEYVQLDRYLITALVDRRRPETSTFHLRVGEMTITLGDVAVLLGVPIDGAPLRNPEGGDYMEMCQRLLGITPPADQWMGNEQIITSWYKAQFVHDIPHNATQEQIEQRARAIILWIITQCLICDHSKTRVWLRWLHFIEDFDICRQYSWGSATLAYTYTELTRTVLNESPYMEVVLL